MSLITPPPTKPNRGTDETTFNNQIDAFLAWLAVFWTELASFVSGLNNYSTTSTSTTNLAIQTGVRNITVAVGKSYQVGMSVKLAVTADGTKWMYGDVLSYDDVTGAFSFYCTAINGSGSFNAWTLSASAPGYEAHNFSDTGTADALVVSAPWASYTKNKSITVVKGNAANTTTTPTLNVAGLGAKMLYDEAGNALEAGVLKAFIAFTALYDDTLNTGAGGFRCLGIRSNNQVGELFWYGGDSPPSYGLVPNGAALSTTTYAKLFAKYGYKYGGSGGTFNLPNLPFDFTLVHGPGSVGTQTAGQNLAHDHPTSPVASTSGSGNHSGTFYHASSGNTTPDGFITNAVLSRGGSANLAAGMRGLLCVRYI